MINVREKLLHFFVLLFLKNKYCFFFVILYASVARILKVPNNYTIYYSNLEFYKDIFNSIFFIQNLYYLQKRFYKLYLVPFYSF